MKERMMSVTGWYARCGTCECPVIIVDNKVSNHMTVYRDEMGVRFMPHRSNCEKIKK